ncbi:MAG: hypothetical protein AB7O57_16160 [Hyphomicrobiaceae bacterium]
MSESEHIQAMFGVMGTVLTVFSLFFSLVSGYLAALYLFLSGAPLVLRSLAFALLSIGLVFLGGVTVTVQNIQNGLFSSWAKLQAPMMPLSQLRNPVTVAALSDYGLSMQEVGVGIGWAVAVCVYVALAYLTFVYKWHSGPGTGERRHG